MVEVVDFGFFYYLERMNLKLDGVIMRVSLLGICMLFFCFFLFFKLFFMLFYSDKCFCSVFIVIFIELGYVDIFFGIFNNFVI